MVQTCGQGRIKIFRHCDISVFEKLASDGKLSWYGSGSGVVLKVLPFDAPPFIFTVEERLALVVLPGAFLISTTNPDGASGALPGFEGHSVHYIR